ncbi:hypothetical protein CISIN_1g036489mg [Citrus sinensis]|uniref:At3g05675-like ankyrin-like domain-containing protein n=1 Tax=Citrus sinensis TaxID=2711 RepID=A0A067G511_CITSI|nr:hypothetical protein CISIN_1g036489mg [Citrus sinensis]
MESLNSEMQAPSKIGDRSTSDVVVRLRTQDSRDDWLYCHSHILIEKCKYFADRLSDNWPTCQIIDSRNCVEVYCQESDFDHHVNVLRLLYVATDGLLNDMWHGVRNALGILQVAVDLGCPQIVTACVSYLEAVPWEEGEEEEIIRIIPNMGAEAEPILAPIRFATSSPSSSMADLKSSAQEQLEYMITEDDDAPILTADDEIKSEVKQCVKRLFSRFNNVLEALLAEHEESISEEEKMQLFQSHLLDLSWACQILSKMEIMREFASSWVDASDKIIKATEQSSRTTEIVEIKLKVIEVAAKVLEAIGYGTLWLPFARATRPLIDSATTDDEGTMTFKPDGELWQSLESTFVSMILALPSGDQTEILTEWLENQHIHYPDLTEAFEVWCFRSKVAKRRLGL